jgi:uncharacterized zinc-type alcohol dehydrogenase-like protein
MIDAHFYAAFDPKSPLKAWDFQRREVGDDDVQIDILFCGVCHSDRFVIDMETLKAEKAA